MPRKIRKVTIYDEHYDCHIVYLFGKDVHWLKKYIKRKHGNAKTYSWGTEFKFGEDANTTNAYQFHVTADLGDGETFYVWMADITPYLLFHETDHLRNDILYTRGVAFAHSSEEAYVYYGGWIFDKVFKKISGSLPKK